jgi:hypothetical protein
VARIVEGDPRKVICKEAEKLKPAAVVMGTRGRGIVQRFIPHPTPPTPLSVSFFTDFIVVGTSVYCREV